MFGDEVGFEIFGPYAGGSYTLHGTDRPADVIVPGANVYASGGAAGATVGLFGSTVTSIDKEDYAQFDGKFSTDWANLPAVKFGARVANHSRSLEFIPIVLSAAGARSG